MLSLRLVNRVRNGESCTSFGSQRQRSLKRSDLLEGGNAVVVRRGSNK